jgi:dolichol-phosphate mannosyltransferase
MSSASWERGTDRADRLVSIILTTYNERENILEAIRSIARHIPRPFEIIVVDDDSPDGTWQLVAEQDWPEVKLIRRVATRGLASAFMRGIIESQGEIVGWMDADMSTPPSLLPLMIERLRDYDVVIGSRYVAGGADQRRWFRRHSSLTINRFARLVLGYGIHDYDSGFVVVRRSVFDKVLFTATGHGEYFIEFIYACCRKGLRVCEVPYTFRDRREGISKSFPSLWTFAKLGLGYVLTIVRVRFRKID